MREHKLTRGLYLTIEDDIMHFHRVYQKYDCQGTIKVFSSESTRR